MRPATLPKEMGSHSRARHNSSNSDANVVGQRERVNREKSGREVEVEETNPAVRHALAYAERGWKVFRLPPQTKLPMKGSHSFKDASDDPETIRQWWGESPLWNVAVATGRPSGIIAVCPDLYKPNCRWPELEREHGTIVTYRDHSPSGGQHLLFRMPAGTKIGSHSDTESPIPGVDIKSDGGYIVMPPSIVQGGRYKNLVNLPPTRLPEWLLSLLVTETGRAKAKSGPRNDYCDSVHSVTPPADLAEAVRRAMPDRKHENNHHLFLLSRSLLGLERNLGRKLSLSENTEAFSLWYRKVDETGLLRPGRTKEDYMSEFANARQCARVALGDDPVTQAWRKSQSEPLPEEAGVWETPEKKLLVALCYQLHLAAKGQRWFLSCRDAARLVLPCDPLGFVKANRWLNEFVGLGILELVERGNAIRATRYRYVARAVGRTIRHNKSNDTYSPK